MISRPIFQKIRAQRLLLEYDDDRSGTFDPLKDIPEDKVVVLGLVTTKSPRRESREELTMRINEASQFVPLERLAVSPQCGFSSSIIGNRLSADDQKHKLKTLVKVAQRFWDRG